MPIDDEYTPSVIIRPDSVYTSSRIVSPSSTSITGGNDWYFDTSGTANVSTMIWSAWNDRYTSMTAATMTPNYLRHWNRTPEPVAGTPHVPDRGTLRMHEIETAKSRAEGLLREHLSDRQKADLDEKKYFDVCAINFRAGTRRYYRIKRGRAGNVFLLDGPHGREVVKYCCHPLEQVPDADTMLAQKMMIEFNEELFLKTANITNLITGQVLQGQGLQATG